MLRDKGLILVFLLVLALLLVPFVHGDDEPGSHVRIVRLSSVSGQVQVSHQQGGYQNATMNVPIVQGDVVRTGNDGWVEIQFENGSVMRLAPESQITFAVLTRFPSGATGTEVNLDDGEAAFAVLAGDDDGPFRVNVRQRVISLKRSSRFRVTSTTSDPLEVVVWRGEVGILDRDTTREVTVKKHDVFTLDPLDAEHYALENDAKADELDDWANQRDQYLSSYASSNNSVQTYAQAPYQYGVSDLNYYGQYLNVNGCGYCWQPYGVGPGWDPFMNGYWDYWSGGSVWVSAYPWGWMPYRFGQWVFVPGFGWVWQPGLWNRWVPVPPVVNAPAGFRPPVPPHAVASKSANTPGSGNRFEGRVIDPALTTTVDKNNRTVISNEHTPAPPVNTAQAPPAGTPLHVVRVHPPVELRPMTPQQSRAVYGTSPQVHVSSPMTSAPSVSRPQVYTAPQHSYTPPPPPAPSSSSSASHGSSSSSPHK